MSASLPTSLKRPASPTTVAASHLAAAAPAAAAAASDNNAVVAPPSIVDLSHLEDDEEDEGSPAFDQEDEEGEEGDDDQHYYQTIAECDATIVGIRYYDGTAHAGEFVTLVREPSNPYDRHAIRVDNVQGEKVGHIKGTQARVIAKWMDQADALGLSLEGTIPCAGNQWQLPCSLQFFAVAASAEQLQERVLPLAQQLKADFRTKMRFKSHIKRPVASASKAAATKAAAPAVESKTMDWSTQAKQLDDMFDQQTAQQLQDLPPVVLPSALTTKLLAHQHDGLPWLVQQDTHERLPFYSQRKEQGQPVWYCDISNSSHATKPKGFRGGILADEMGLGKTLQMIALMLAAPPPPVSTPTKRQCTLIVCPVSVMSNWDQQIETHVKEGVLNIGFYQGANRTKLLPQIRDGTINVLLVSYHTLAAEFTKVFGKPNNKNKKQQSDSQPPPAKRKRVDSIFDDDFHRIVLDEAHTIRSSRTTFFHACTRISAGSKWALTGTPFVNRADDVFSLLSFLGVEPLCDKKMFQRAISIPIQNGDDAGLACLRVAMSHVALRRSKATAKLQLAKKTVKLTRVSFEEGSSHKAVYDALFGSVRMAFEAVLQEGGAEILKNYTNIFEKLLRMRQACCSAKLVPPVRREKALELWKELQQRDSSKKLTAKEGLELLKKLKGAFTQEAKDELPECAVCLMEMEEENCIILRTCAHVYCQDCISRVCTDSKPNCPLCRKAFAKSDLIKKSAASVAATHAGEQGNNMPMDNENICLSPKVMALLEAIKGMKQDEKGVIFSQFTSFLDLIQAALKDAGHTYTRLDGSMHSAKRNEAVQAFSSDDDDSPRFMLASTLAAGTGINLTRGSVAFMMDCWWNSAVENQAMDRVHRIGQKRDVTILRFVMKNSLEERMIALQEAKSMQAMGAMQKLKPEEKRKARLADLQGLLMIDGEN